MCVFDVFAIYFIRCSCLLFWVTKAVVKYRFKVNLCKCVSVNHAVLGPIYTERTRMRIFLCSLTSLSVNSYIENSGNHLLATSLSRSLLLGVNEPLTFDVKYCDTKHLRNIRESEASILTKKHMSSTLVLQYG